MHCGPHSKHLATRLNMYDSLSVQSLNALLWTFTTVAILLSVGRFTIRYVTASRFYWDDASHLLSLVLLIALAGTYTAGFPYSARIAKIGLKEEPAPPLTDPFYHTYLQLRVVVTLLVFLVLWAVKATFLIFYRLLFEVSQTFIRVWWAAVAITFASFWVCFGSTFTICGSASDLYDYKKCASPQALHNIRATYKYWCALNVSSDLIVIVLPLFMVWGLQLRTSQKVVLAGIFSLAFVVAVFDILRTVESLESGTFSGVALWSSLEVTIAVIVASLPLYRVLLTNKGRKSLLSHTSLLGRYKDMSDSQTAVERKSSDDRSSRRKPSVNTFRDDLETQNLTPPIRGERGQQFPLAHLPH